MSEVTPDPKPRKRHKATSYEWVTIRFGFNEDPKCRMCMKERWTDLHHCVPRSQGGDDTEENLIALCADCHRGVTENRLEYLMALRWALTPAQNDYCVERKGVEWLEKKYPKVMAL